jgi:hypothetical protein
MSDTKINVRPPSKNPAADRAGSTAEKEDIKGSIFDAEVVEAEPNGAYTVRHLINGEVTRGCEDATGFAASILGVNQAKRYTKGTRVLVLNGRAKFIVGAQSTDTPVYSADRSLLGGSARPESFKGSADGRTVPGPRPAVDLLDGEVDMTNQLGVGMRLLTTLAQLNAGDRAKVETFLLDGLVRIFSQTFRHFHAAGEDQVYDDGRLNIRQDATSYPHEALGMLNPTDGVVGEENAENVATASLEDAVAQTGRWRYSKFIGHLGNFVQTLVTDPTETLGVLAENALRSGKARQQIMADGTVLVQSTSEICIERVCRIQVPIELKTQDDPEGVLQAEYEDLERKYLEIWKDYETTDGLMDAAYRLREYARWLNTYHSFGRMLQSGDWKIPSEDDTPEPSWTNHEEDVEQSNSDILTSYDTYACIRIMRDGSIVTWAGDGSCTVMNRGDIVHSAARDLHLRAAGSIHIQSGNDIHMMARRNIQIFALFGGLTIKARAWMHALCERGSIWLKADVDPESEGYTAPMDAPEPKVLDHAIMIDAPAGGVGVSSGRRLELNSDDTDASRGGVVIRSMSKLRLIAQRDVEMRGQVVAIKTPQLWVRATRFFGDVSRFAFDGMFEARKGLFRVSRVEAHTVDAQERLSGPTGGSGRAIVSPTGQNEDESWAYEHADDGTMDGILSWPPDGALDLDTNRPFDPTDEAYTWSVSETDLPYRPEVSFEDLTQQRLRVDTPPDETDDGEGGTMAEPFWQAAQQRLLSGLRTTASFLSRENARRHYQADYGADLRTPLAGDPGSSSVIDAETSRVRQTASRSATWRYKRET